VVLEGSAKTSQSDRLRAKHQAFAEDATNSDGDAMDIDDTPPSEKTASAQVPLAEPPRSSPRPKSTKTGTVPNGDATSSPPATAAKAPAPGLSGLSGLANVEPFLPSSVGGLGGLDELKDTLPFKSQPSNSHPTKSNTVQKLKFPTIPAAPLPPPGKLTQAAADFYFAQMEGYIRQFKNYSEALTKHFAGRNAELNNLDDRFVRQRGETTQKLGFASYLKKMKEDEEVMVVWKLAQEKHIKALEQCGEVRNKMKQYLSSG
jgi:hypothetical protein